VTSLSLSPVDDTLLSAAEDNSVRLWDLRTPNSQGVVHTPAAAASGFDPKGVVFAVAVGNVVRLFDVRQHERVRVS
jgi:COMPASS component SWD2